MSESRSKYAKRNIVSGTANKVITLILPFLVRTVIIRTLGAEYLGLGSLFSAILQVLNMAELGFSSAVVFSLYKPIAEGKDKEVCALLLYYRKVYRIVGIVILCVGSAVIPFLPRLIKGSYPEAINLYLLYGIYLSTTVISYFAYAYKSVIFTASQKQSIISNVDSVLAMLRYGIQIIFLLCFKNYYLYIIWNLISTVANNIVIAYLTNKMYPQYYCKGKLDDYKKDELTKQIKGLAIGKFSLVARNSFDSIVLSLFCGLIDVAIYSNYYYIYSAVGGLINVVVQGMAAGIGNSVAVESKEKNYLDFKRFNTIYNWIYGFCTVCLYSLYQPFMRLWVGADLTADRVIVILFCVYFYISQMTQVRAAYANAAGLWWEFRYYEIAEMIANLCLNFALGYVWGMKGILLATIITVSLFSLIGITQQTFKHYFYKSTIEFWIQSFVFIIITIVASIITAYVSGRIESSNYLQLVVKGIMCVILSNIFFLIVFVINSRYRGYLKSVIINVFDRK